MPAEFTPVQQFMWDSPFWTWLCGLFGNPPWPGQPEQEHIVLPRDTRRVAASEVRRWPDELRGTIVRCNQMQSVYKGSLGGVPVQRGHVSRRRGWTSINPWLGNRVTYPIFPEPEVGWYWTEGNPTIGGAWDRHRIIVDATGDIFEIIGANTAAGTCLSWGRWRDGVLVEETAATASRLPMHRHLYTGMEASDTVLGLVLPNITAEWGGDGSGTWPWPRYGDIVRLSDIGLAEAMRAPGVGAHGANILRDANERGLVVMDRGPAGIVVQAGRWTGLDGVAFPVTALEAVTAMTDS